MIVGDMIPERLAQARTFGCETIDLRNEGVYLTAPADITVPVDLTVPVDITVPVCLTVPVCRAL